MKSNEKPIGIFDSGLGGLTVLKAVNKILPNENIIYFGDTARLPYGNKSPETVKKFSSQIVKFLLKKNVKLIIIACNTSSALAASYLRKKFNIPLFDIVKPGVDLSSRTSINRKLAVFATKATIGSHTYKKGVMKINNRFRVYEVECPLLVPLIEEGEISGKLINLVTKRYISKISKKGIDTVVLGCTHYPIIEDVFRRNLDGIKIINPAYQLTHQVKNYLISNSILNISKKRGKIVFYVTDVNENFKNVAKMFLHEQNSIKLLKTKLNSNI